MYHTYSQMPSPMGRCFLVQTVKPCDTAFIVWALNHKQLTNYGTAHKHIKNDTESYFLNLYYFKFQEEKSVANLTTLLKNAYGKEIDDLSVEILPLENSYPAFPQSLQEPNPNPLAFAINNTFSEMINTTIMTDKIPLEEKEWTVHMTMKNMKTLHPAVTDKSDEKGDVYALRSFIVEIPLPSKEYRLPDSIQPLVRNMRVKYGDFTLRLNGHTRGQSTNQVLDLEIKDLNNTTNNELMQLICVSARNQYIEKTILDEEGKSLYPVGKYLDLARIDRCTVVQDEYIPDNVLIFDCIDLFKVYNGCPPSLVGYNRYRYLPTYE